MCSKATCRRCGKTTWSGCGMHVRQVMRGVPASQQCTCSSQTQNAVTPAVATKRGRLSSLFRR